jgi:copper chaperone CopZ
MSALSSSGTRACLPARWRLSAIRALSLLALGLVVLGATPSPAGREVLVTVKGVTYPFATFGIVKRLEQMPGVEHVTFDLKDGLADVKLKPGAEVTDDQLRDAVKNASYTPGNIRWLPDPTRPANSAP